MVNLGSFNPKALNFNKDKVDYHRETKRETAALSDLGSIPLTDHPLAKKTFDILASTFPKEVSYVGRSVKVASLGVMVKYPYGPQNVFGDPPAVDTIKKLLFES